MLVADDFDQVTVVFCEICNFHALASRYSAHTIISVLNVIYTAFDELMDKYRVHKVRSAVAEECRRTATYRHYEHYYV